MRITKLCIVLGIIILTTLDSASSQGQTTSRLTYDLLFASYIDHGNDSFELELNYLDTTTQQVYQLPVSGVPVLNGLSPDEKYLVVYQDNLMCLVDPSWVTSFCLSRDLVQLDIYPSAVYWEADSASFWVDQTPLSETELTLLQISAIDGSVIRKITIAKDDLPRTPMNLMYIYWMSPDSMVVSISRYVLYDLEMNAAVSASELYRGEASSNGQLICYFDDLLSGNVLSGNVLVKNLEGMLVTEISSETYADQNIEMLLRSDVDFIECDWSSTDEFLVLKYHAPREESEPGQFYTFFATFLYTRETGELQLIQRRDELSWWLTFSPDDVAFADFYSRENQYISIVMLEDGSEFTVDISDHYFGYRSGGLDFMSRVWIPHGWLQVDISNN